MSINTSSEKIIFIKQANLSRATYKNNDNIAKRTRRIFGTFSRALSGRKYFHEHLKQNEINNLSYVVQNEIVHPLLIEPANISHSQTGFDNWHKRVAEIIKDSCPVSWHHGSCLTFGMIQKIINLHCKDLWALELVPDKYSCFFHPVIDRITLDMLGLKKPWTNIDSYDNYMQIQNKLRIVAKARKTYPLVIECWWWNNNR